MRKPFKMTIQTPYGQLITEAYSFVGLAEVMPKDIRDAMELVLKREGRAEQIRREYCLQFDTRQSKIVQAGLQTTLIKLFLEGMMIDEAVDWLKENRNFRASRSAVGRFWSNLSKLGVVPLRSVAAPNT